MLNPEDFISRPTNSFEDSFDLPLTSFTDRTMADTQYEILIEEIKDFETNLNENEEIALQLASFGQSVLMNVVEIGYHNPSLVFFYGYVNGQRSQLIQHVSQLNFLITSAQKTDPDRPARRIGFLPETD